MPYRTKWACVVIRDRKNRLRHHYKAGSGAVGDFSGPIIPWLSDEQAEHLLKLGAIERIEENPVNTSSAVDWEVELQCLKALEHLGVDLGAGAPTCRSALREGGFRFGNDVVAVAVKDRKEALDVLNSTRPEALSGKV